MGGVVHRTSLHTHIKAPPSISLLHNGKINVVPFLRLTVFPSLLVNVFLQYYVLRKDSSLMNKKASSSRPENFWLSYHPQSM